jgi:hypothetical protein
MANNRLQYFPGGPAENTKGPYVRRHKINYQYLAIIPFFINPLITIVGLTIYLINQKEKKDATLYLLYFLISIYLGLINTTKVPESDLLRYKADFDLASGIGFFSYLSQYPKEIVFFIVTYFSNKVFFGNFKLYVILFTFFQYYLIFISIHKFWKSSDKHVLIFSVIIFAIFSRNFFVSAHLVRQVLAGSIFVYFFITRIVDKKTIWWLIPIAVLIHSSSIMLFIVSFIPRIGEKISGKNAIIISVAVIGGVLFGNQIINLLDSLTRGMSYLNYPFQRFHTMEMLEYSWYTGESEGSLRYWYYVQLLPIIVFGYLFPRKKSAFYPVLNVTLTVFLILEIFVFSGLLYMQMRSIYYLYLMVPFIYPLLFVKNKLYDYKPFEFAGMAFIFSWFVYRLLKGFLDGEMEFSPLGALIINPVPLYFIN